MGGGGQVVSLAQRMDLLSVFLARRGQHCLAEGPEPAGKMQPLNLLPGVVSNSARLTWQGVNNCYKSVICLQGQHSDTSCSFAVDLHCLLFLSLYLSLNKGMNSALTLKL